MTRKVTYEIRYLLCRAKTTNWTPKSRDLQKGATPRELKRGWLTYKCTSLKSIGMAALGNCQGLPGKKTWEFRADKRTVEMSKTLVMLLRVWQFEKFPPNLDCTRKRIRGISSARAASHAAEVRGGLRTGLKSLQRGPPRYCS